jgi:hypothetical protein
MYRNNKKDPRRASIHLFPMTGDIKYNSGCESALEKASKEIKHAKRVTYLPPLTLTVFT